MEPHEKKFEELKSKLDNLIDYYNMEGTVQAVDAVTAIDNLHREFNRASFVEREDNGKGTKL